MIPMYRYMDSNPFQKSTTPFTYQYPSMETIPSYSMMDPTKSCMPPHDSGRNYWHCGYPMPSYSCCNSGNFLPGCCNFRPSHLPVPPHQHMHCYGGYPPCPEPYYVRYVPPTHYNVEQPRYEFDKSMMRNRHCCGCPNSLCGQNQKGENCVKIEEEKPDSQRKGSLVPFQLGNNQPPIVWIPPDHVGSEKEREPSETGNGKQEKERRGLNLTENLKSLQQAPKLCSGWPLSDLSRLGSFLPDAAGMGDQSVQNKQQEDIKKEFPFPVIWMPAFGREEAARKADVQNLDAPARPSDEPFNAGKLVPTNMLKKDDATSEGPEVVKTVNQINIPEMDMIHKTEDTKKNKERRCIPVEAVKNNEEKEELSRNNVKGRSSSSPKKSRLPPVCLRVDPPAKKKNGNGSSRSSSPQSTAVKGSSQLDSKINNVTGEPDGEKIIKTVEVKTHETPDGNHQVDKESVSSTGEPLSLPTQSKSQEKSADKLCKEEEESHREEYGEKDKAISKASPEKAVDERLEVSSGGSAQEEGKLEKPNLSDNEAAVLIQSAYRGYGVRKWELLKKMKQLVEVRQKVIEVQNRVKALELAPQDEKEQLFVGEMIMRLLLKLDTIQGLHPSIREFRKSLAKELVALEEKLDCMVINKPTEVVPEASIKKPTEHFDVETHDDIKEEQEQKDVVSTGEIFPKGVNESDSLLGESHEAQTLVRVDDMAGFAGMKASTGEELEPTRDGHGKLQEVIDQNTMSEAEQLAKPREHGCQNEDTSGLSSQYFSNQIEGEEVMPSLMGEKRADEDESGAEMEQNVKLVNDAEENVDEVLQMDMNEETLHHHRYFSEDGHPVRDSLEVHVLSPDSDDQVGAQAGQTPEAIDKITISTPYEKAADMELPMREDGNSNKPETDKLEHVEMRRGVSEAEENSHNLAVKLDSDGSPTEKQGAPDESAALPGEQSNSNDDLIIQNELLTDEDRQQTDEVEKVLEDEWDNHQARRACDQSAESLGELSESYRNENIKNEMVTNENEQQTADTKNKMAEDVLQDPCVLEHIPSCKLDNQANELHATGEATSIEMGEVSLPALPNAQRETVDKHDLVRDREMDEKLVEENEKMREMVDKLMEAGKEQIAIISKLSGRVKDLEKRLARKKKQRRGCGVSMSRHHTLNGRIKA
ncbi:BAG family molecular chaperone regulator 6 [Cucumis sativus]|uniref:BAG domain-containing protein n=1 Tax=Cucumis sativus TaxID=3659 RepID=A0A0A0KA34_CUCSA|nr:BAG family molecular chaperone regulator 6 [Cucumis sativus]KGN45704.1 hypothetical protein Csa_005304 [Cucumis sativus]